MYCRFSLRGIANAATIILLAGCAGGEQITAPIDQTAAPAAPTQYLIVDSVDNQHFRFAGQDYDGKTLAPALIAASSGDGAHVVVLRGSSTIGQLLSMVPVGQKEKACLFFQTTDSSIKGFTVNNKDGTPVDQSYCPKAIDVLAVVGSYKSEQ